MVYWFKLILNLNILDLLDYLRRNLDDFMSFLYYSYIGIFLKHIYLIRYLLIFYL